MRKFLLCLTRLLITLSIFSLPVKADMSEIPLAGGIDSNFYYEIGSAKSILLPTNPDIESHDLDAALEFGLGYSCGKFDPTLGLVRLLNELKGLGNSIITGAINAVTAAISGLPATILQRVAPGLYDLFQNYVIDIKAIIALANKTCEEYEQAVRDPEAGNPYEEWTQLSKIIDWKIEMGGGDYGSSGVDVVQAKQNVEKNNGDKGTPWIAGKTAGGKNGDAIKITSDIVLAGYNLSLERNADDKSHFNDTSKRLAQIWGNPEDASKWAVDVLGDTLIKTDGNSERKTVTGHGLLPKIAKQTDEYRKKLEALVDGSEKATLENLSEASSNAALITQDIIVSLQDLDPDIQAVSISKLASEAAMSDVLEKALLIRRLLITGSLEPNVKLTPGHRLSRELIVQLDQDIQNVLFERRIHNELASNTPRLILKLNQAHKSRAGTLDAPLQTDRKLIEDGARK